MVDLNTEIPKDVLDKTFEAVELAKKTGKIKKGTNEATKMIERGTAKLVLVAKDINPKEIVMHLPALCEEKDIAFVPVPSREELGTVAGLGVPTSAIAIIQEGDAKKLINEVTEAIKKL